MIGRHAFFMLTANVNYPHLVIFAPRERRRVLGAGSVRAISKYGGYELPHKMLVGVESPGYVLDTI